MRQPLTLSPAPDSHYGAFFARFAADTETDARPNPHIDAGITLDPAFLGGDSSLPPTQNGYASPSGGETGTAGSNRLQPDMLTI